MEQPKNSTTQPGRNRKSRKRLVRWGLVLLGIITAIFLAFNLSPWPSALVIRYAFSRGAEKTSKGLKKYVPDGVGAQLNLQYLPGDDNAFLDVYYPVGLSEVDSVLPVIVWTHGGGWVSGHKEDIANYGRLLAAAGYTVVSIDYSIAPEKKYPTPVRELNTALAYLCKNARRLHVDTTHFFLAGDSGGAHIAAQAGNVITNPAYARLLDVAPGIQRSQLSGLILYCGPYDAGQINVGGGFGWFIRSILWAYLGKKNFTDAPGFNSFSVINYVDADFPPSFISVGNADGLHVQSEALARKLASLHVPVDTLFFNPGYVPALPHEYQFNLDNDAGQTALARSLQFVHELAFKKS